MRIYFAFCLLFCLFVDGQKIFAAFTKVQELKCETLDGLKITPIIYPYFVEPKDYPEYYRRPYPALSWADFGYETQFVAGRNAPKDSVEMAVVKGNVYRPGLSFMRSKDFTQRLQFMSRSNLFLHNIGGYGPGSPFPFHGGFGEYIVPDWQIKQIKRYMGSNFTGFDIGEQDGRFNFTYKHIMEPYISDRKHQYLTSQLYFERIAADLGNWCSSLNVLWYWHYLLKEGYTVLAGAETQNKVTNGQVQYMFLRGAGKQYGILWYGDVSVFDSWGCKIYNPDTDYKDVNKGGSLALMKRSYYTQYMYNSTILSMEHGWCEGEWAANRGILSPIGMMHEDCADFISKYGQPGVMVTQVGLLNDFYSGWMPASHIANSFRVWNGMPYSSGDYLTDAIVNMFYPNYDRCGFFYNETGAMCATPYGENIDALLSDVRVEVMRQYPIIIAAGDLFSGGKELSDKVNNYVKQGGTFIVTAKNANRIWPDWQITEDQIVPAGACIHINGDEIVEQSSFKLYKTKNMSDAHVIASYGNTPIALWIPVGKGKVVLSLTEYGLNAEPYSVKEPPSWAKRDFNVCLERPYRLLNHFEKILNALFSSVELFSLDERLGYIVNYKGEGKFRIAIYNNTLASIPFEIKSNVGEIVSIKELHTGRKLYHYEGYWPNGIEGDTIGKDDENHIYGGDIRLFDVEVRDAKIEVMKKIPQMAPVMNSYLAFENMMFLKENIRKMPTFFDYFSGVAVDGHAILQMDEKALARQNDWYRLQSLDIAADLRKGFQSGFWTFDISTQNYQKTKNDLMEISRKLNLLYGKHLLFIPSDFQDDCPKDLISSCNISFIDDDSNVSNWSYNADYRLLDSSGLAWDNIYAAMSKKHLKNEIKTLEQEDGYVLSQNRNHILALDRYETDIQKAISKIGCFYDAFGGVCISAEYIANKSLEALLDEKKWLEEKGLSVIVSFVEEINHFPGLTLCDAVPIHYKKSMDYYKDVLNKMGRMGLKKALFTTQSSVEANYSEQKVYNKMKETLVLLAQYALKRDVQILLCNTRFRIASEVVQQKEMVGEMEMKNIKLAVNLNHLSANEYVQTIRKTGHLLDAIILGGVGSIEHSEYLPISKSGKSAKELNYFKDVLLIEKVYPVINKTVYDDCKYMGWI